MKVNPAEHAAGLVKTLGMERAKFVTETLVDEAKILLGSECPGFTDEITESQDSKGRIKLNINSKAQSKRLKRNDIFWKQVNREVEKLITKATNKNAS